MKLSRKKLENLFRIDGKVAIITGGAGLLGREFSFALAQYGAHVVVADIMDSKAKQLAEEITENGFPKASGIQVDVSDKESVQKMVEKVLHEFGHIDILVNNAAIDPKFDVSHAGENINDFEHYPLELWNKGIAVNLTGVFLCSQAVAEPMLRQGSGVIVNISSTYGIVGPDQRLYERKELGSVRMYKPVVYSVTKSAIIGLTRYLATYWAGKNIRVNALTPGGVFNRHDDEFVRRYSERTPMGRMADKSEYCGALLFLVSDASSYMTGANLIVDGGWTSW